MRSWTRIVRTVIGCRFLVGEAQGRVEDVAPDCLAAVPGRGDHPGGAAPRRQRVLGKLTPVELETMMTTQTASAA